MTMCEARLEVDVELVAEGGDVVLCGRAGVRVLRVRRDETARATRRPWSRGETREWGTNDAAPWAHATHSRRHEPPFSLGWMGEVLAS